MKESYKTGGARSGLCTIKGPEDTLESENIKE